jgi:isoaspartyl peptidase/L-asparaginase-like protein (Ntn-hydrolase superfamily)
MAQVVWGRFNPGDGGFVGVDEDYNVVMGFNSGGMYRGWADRTGTFETAMFLD